MYRSKTFTYFKMLVIIQHNKNQQNHSQQRPILLLRLLRLIPVNRDIFPRCLCIPLSFPYLPLILDERLLQCRHQQTQRVVVVVVPYHVLHFLLCCGENKVGLLEILDLLLEVDDLLLGAGVLLGLRFEVNDLALEAMGHTFHHRELVFESFYFFPVQDEQNKTIKRIDQQFRFSHLKTRVFSLCFAHDAELFSNSFCFSLS